MRSSEGKPNGPDEAAFFAHDGLFWRRMASFGARRFPHWWVRYSPPFFGVAAAVALPEIRRAVRNNLQHIRGPAPVWRDTLQTAQTFASYAGCMTEVLATGSKNAVDTKVVTSGREHILRALEKKKGALLLTMHTGGWEIAYPYFAKGTSIEVLVVMEGERNRQAQQIHDDARKGLSSHVTFAHVGPDPLSALPIVHHLRSNGAVAMQIDRPPPSGRTILVELMGRRVPIPEGPFRLAQLTGAPMTPVFTARLGYRHYRVRVYPAISIERRAPHAALEEAAQQVATTMGEFLREHPTQWFHFRSTGG